MPKTACSIAPRSVGCSPRYRSFPLGGPHTEFSPLKTEDDLLGASLSFASTVHVPVHTKRAIALTYLTLGLAKCQR